MSNEQETVHQGRHDAKGIRVAILVSRFNESVTDKLLEGALACLNAQGGAARDRWVARVPGAWELPQLAARVAKSGDFDAIVTLGALIRGETTHFEWISQEVSRRLGEIAADTGVAVTFGVLTTENAEQATARCGGDEGNKGYEAALAALEMVHLSKAFDAREGT